MKVRIKSGHCPSYLTIGKLYKAKLFVNFNGFNIYTIFDDRGIDQKIRLKFSFQLNGGSWEIVDE